MDRAAQSGVQQRRRIATVDDADRVVVLLAGFALEDHPPLLQLDRPQPHRHCDRRRWQLTGDHRGHVLHAAHGRPGRGRRHRVLPNQGAAAGAVGIGGGKRLGHLSRRAFGCADHAVSAHLISILR